MTDKVFKAWKETGLLDNLSQDYAWIFAYKLNDFLEMFFSIYKDGKENQEEYDILGIFPFVARRIFEFSKDFDIFDAHARFRIYYKNNFQILKDTCTGFYTIDYEMELCSEFVDYYKSILKLLLVKERFKQKK